MEINVANQSVRLKCQNVIKKEHKENEPENFHIFFFNLRNKMFL